jgi:hypothetical protein
LFCFLFLFLALRWAVVVAAREASFGAPRGVRLQFVKLIDAPGVVAKHDALIALIAFIASDRSAQHILL